MNNNFKCLFLLLACNYSLFSMEIMENLPAEPTTIGTEINSPGTYGFTFLGPLEPQIYNDSLITINSSDVVVDLKNCSFSQTGTLTGFNGIKINPYLSNIVIKNGCMKDLTGKGIYISDGCSEIQIEKMIINSCDAGGIYCDGSTYGCAGLSITESSISTCTGLDYGPAYGLYVKNASNVNITRSYFTYNNSKGSPAYAAYLENCDSCHFINAVFGYNSGTPLGVGVYMKNCTDSQFLYCSGSYNYLTDNLSTSSAIGFVFDGTSGSGITQSVAVKNGALVGNGIGYKILNGSNNLFKECDAQGNSGSNTGAGYVLSGSEDSTHILESYSLSNVGGSAGYGILIDGATNCTILDNRLNNHSGAVAGVAYLDTSTSNGNVIKHNLYYHNSTQADVD